MAYGRWDALCLPSNAEPGAGPEQCVLKYPLNLTELTSSRSSWLLSSRVAKLIKSWRSMRSLRLRSNGDPPWISGTSLDHDAACADHEPGDSGVYGPCPRHSGLWMAADSLVYESLGRPLLLVPVQRFGSAAPPSRSCWLNQNSLRSPCAWVLLYALSVIGRTRPCRLLEPNLAELVLYCTDRDHSYFACRAAGSGLAPELRRMSGRSSTRVGPLLPSIVSWFSPSWAGQWRHPL